MHTKLSFSLTLFGLGQASTNCGNYNYPIQIGGTEGHSTLECFAYDRANSSLYAMGQTEDNNMMAPADGFSAARGGLIVKYHETSSLLKYVKVIQYTSNSYWQIAACNLSDMNEPIFNMEGHLVFGRIDSTKGALEYAGIFTVGGSPVYQSYIHSLGKVFKESGYYYSAFNNQISKSLCIFRFQEQVGVTRTAMDYMKCSDTDLIKSNSNLMTYNLSDGYIITHSFMDCESYGYCGFHTYAEQFTVLTASGSQVINGYDGAIFLYGNMKESSHYVIGSTLNACSCQMQDSSNKNVVSFFQANVSSPSIIQDKMYEIEGQHLTSSSQSLCAGGHIKSVSGTPIIFYSFLLVNGGSSQFELISINTSSNQASIHSVSGLNWSSFGFYNHRAYFDPSANSVSGFILGANLQSVTGTSFSKSLLAFIRLASSNQCVSVSTPTSSSPSIGSSSWYADQSDIIYSDDLTSTYQIGDYKDTFIYDDAATLTYFSGCAATGSQPVNLIPGDTVIGDTSYIVSDPAEVLEADPYYLDCYLADEDISYSFTQDGGAITNPSLSATDTVLTVHTTDSSQEGIFDMILEASIGTPSVDEITDSSQTFQLDISACCLVQPATGNVIADQTYLIQTDGTKTYTFDDFTKTDLSGAALPVTYTTSTLPGFVSFDSATRTFTFQSNDNADAASSPYIIEVSARDRNGFVNDPGITISFTLMVTAYTVTLNPPSWTKLDHLIGDPQSDQAFSACTTDYLGPTSISHAVTLSSGASLPYCGISFNEPTLTISANSASAGCDGIYTLHMTCTESINSAVEGPTVMLVENFYITLIVPATLTTTHTYTVNDSLQTYSFDPYTSADTIGTITFTLLQPDSTPCPSYISVDSVLRTLSIYTENNSEAGTFNCVIHAIEDLWGVTDSSASFIITINMYDPIGLTSTLEDFEYVLETYDTYTFPQFTIPIYQGDTNLAYTALEQGTSSLMPFASFSPASLTFNFDLASDEDEGEYIIEVTCTDSISSNILADTFILTVRLSNHPPYWLGEFIPLQMYAEDEYNYYLPKYIDQDPGHILYLTFNEEEKENLPDFISYQTDPEGNEYLQVRPKAEDLGNFYIECYVHDERENFGMKILEISITQFFEVCKDITYSSQILGLGDQLIITSNNYEETGCQSSSFLFLDASTQNPLEFGESSAEKLIVTPTQESNVGKYTIEVFETSGSDLYVTNFQLEVLTLEAKEEREQNQILEQTQLFYDPQYAPQMPLEVEIEDFTFTGELVLLFNKRIQKIESLSGQSGHSYQALLFEIRSDNLSEDQKINSIKSWKAISQTNNKLSIQIEFNSPLSISSSQEKDKLVLKIMNNIFFISTKGDLLQTYEPLKTEIPEQVPKSDEKVIESIGTAFQDFGIGASVISLTLSIFLGVSLKLVWKLLGAIQLMVHFPLFSIGFPSNCKYLYSFIIDLANMKIIPTTLIIEKITGQTQKVKQGDLKYNGNFIQNFGMLFFIAVAFTFFLGGIAFIGLAFKGNKKVLNIITKIKQKIFYNSFLRFLVQSYLLLCFSSFKNMVFLDFSNKFTSFSSTITVAVFIILTVTPAAITVFLIKNQRKLENQEFKQKFESIYMDLKTWKKEALFQIPFFTARRYILVFIMIFCPSLGFFQMQILLMTSVTSVVFAYSFLPFKEKLSSHLEVFNEVTLMAMSYITLSYTDFQWDPFLKYEAGWFMIYLFLFNLSVNVLVILFKIIQGFFKKFQKKKYYKKVQEKKVRISPQNSQIMSINVSPSQTFFELSPDHTTIRTKKKQFFSKSRNGKAKKESKKFQHETTDNEIKGEEVKQDYLNLKMNLKAVQKGKKSDEIPQMSQKSKTDIIRGLKKRVKKGSSLKLKIINSFKSPVKDQESQEVPMKKELEEEEWEDYRQPALLIAKDLQPLQHLVKRRV